MLFMVLMMMNCDSKIKQTEQMAQAFIDSLTNVIKPLNKAANLAYWEATASGEDEYYERYAGASLELATIYANSADFEKLKALKSSKIKDLLLARQIEILYYRFLAKQIETTLLKQITEMQTAVEARFNKFRGKIDGRAVTGNDIKEILVSSNDLTLRKKAWEASKQVAPAVEKDMLALVHIRNEAARKLGFNNFQPIS